MGNFWKKASPWLAGAGAGLISNMTPLKQYSPVISGAAGAMTSKNPLSGFAAGVGGGALGAGAKGGIQSMFGNKTGSAMDNFWSGGKSGMTDYVGKLPGFKGFGTDTPTGAFAKFLSPGGAGVGRSTALPSVTSKSSGITPWEKSYADMKNRANLTNTVMGTNIFSTQPSTTASVGEAPSSMSSGIKPKSVLSSFMPDGTDMGRFGVGMALPLMADMFTEDVPASDFSSVTGPLKDRILSTSPEKQAAINAYMQQVGGQPLDVEPALSNIKLRSDREKADSIRALDQSFSAAMPGSNWQNSSEYQKARADLESRYAQNYDAQVAQSQLEYDMAQRQRQSAAASALAGMDQAQIQSLANLAQYDIYTIAEQTGYDLQKAQSLKDLATTAGSYLMQSGLGLYDQKGGEQ